MVLSVTGHLTTVILLLWWTAMSVIAAHRGARLTAEAASYIEVDEAAAATLGRSGGTPTGCAGLLGDVAG